MCLAYWCGGELWSPSGCPMASASRLGELQKSASSRPWHIAYMLEWCLAVVTELLPIVVRAPRLGECPIAYRSCRPCVTRADS
eukprot:1161755-Pelagomonas_calceolata.AAC.7